ncbi:MAG: ribonuclease III [Desulfovibrio sp.]|nr:ribonuclease III [Desulfovibrio sp.]
MQLLTHALMHSSWANEHQMEGLNNQRLEFLGDAVLELCITDELYHRYPQFREGALTEIRARLVSEAELARLGRELGIDKALLLGRGEEHNAGRDRDSIIADAFEAVLAAIYEDGGIESARKVVKWVYRKRWEEASRLETKKDAKSRLQELCQKLYRETPNYIRLGQSGPDHAKTFEVKLILPDGQEFVGLEKSAKRAEHAAAALALETFKNANQEFPEHEQAPDKTGACP